MRQTRFVIINGLRSVLGHSEEAEHVIDWVRDLRETSDLLVKLVDRECAHQIINAMNVCSDPGTPYDLASYDLAHEHANQCLLNERYFCMERKSLLCGFFITSCTKSLHLL